MTISGTAWERYIASLRKINDAAANRVLKRLEELGGDLANMSRVTREAFIDWAYTQVQIYGSGAAELACEAFDAAAELSNIYLPAAEPAALASYGEVAKAVNGTLKTGNPDIVADAVARMVKLAAVDTTMNNAIRASGSGAQWAWIPHGETCAFCIMLASRGWQRPSKKALKGGHAEHIHANCDCTYAVRFDSKSKVEGYDPDRYLDMYENADGSRWQDKLNSMRRDFYGANSEEINEQKRSAYAKRIERNSSAAEETNAK